MLSERILFGAGVFMDWMLLLFPMAFLALSSLGGDEDDPEPAPEPDPEPEPGDPEWWAVGEVVTLGDDGDEVMIDHPGFSGRIQGGAGDDLISVTATADRDLRFAPDDYGIGAFDDDGEFQYYDPNTGEIGGGPLTSPVFRGLTQIEGGAGDDTITAAGAGMWIDGGTGADVLDLRGLRNSFVRVDDGDLVFGSDIDTGRSIDGVRVVGHGAVTFEAGAANADVRVTGAATLTGGAGNDTLAAGDDGSVIRGGAGNDRLYGNYAPRPWLEFTNDIGFDDFVGGGSAMLDGGEGNDHIQFDLADTVTGGAGADSLQGWLDVGHVAVVTDFDPAEDRAEITVPTLDPDHPTGGITLEEQDGDSILMKDGQPILRLDGVTGLTGVIEIERPDSGASGDIRLVDLEGNPQPGPSWQYSFVIRAF